MLASNRLSSQLGVTSVSDVCALPLYSFVSSLPLIVIVSGAFVIVRTTFAVPELVAVSLFRLYASPVYATVAVTVAL